MKKTRAAPPDFSITNFSDYGNVRGQYTERFIKSSHCVKISEDESCVTVAVSESFANRIETVRKVHAPKEVRAVTVSDSAFAEFTGNNVERCSRKERKMSDDGRDFTLESIRTDAPAVNIINAVCLEAIRKGASDIHIQGTQEEVIIRLRIDGVLHTVRKFDLSILEYLASRVKIMAGLNVMENRLCQDGRISVQSGDRKIDFRVSIIPSVTGQDIVFRLFNGREEELSLDQLGFSEGSLSLIKKSLKNPYGLILATGPTGSGKTTTLHAMLKSLDAAHLKIVTIEDPVEKILDGMEQIQVNDEINLTFENILRRILRHDPDVIMVGEIRDRKTAELSVRAALTGHLILSTLHTNDSVSAVSRLKNLGIEPYLIAGTLKTVIAQRLVRKTCLSCGGKGCPECSGTGFSGRTAASEVFLTDGTIRTFIEENRSDDEIRKYLAENKFRSLREDALSKVRSCVTAESEIIREGLS